MLEFINDPWQIGIGVIGTAASLSSVFLAEPTLRSRAIHVCYTGAIVFIVFLMTSYNSRLEAALLETEQASTEIQKEIAELTEIRNRAAGVYKSMYNGFDQGENRGNVLQAISFFETYSDRYPKSLELLIKLAGNAGVVDSAVSISDDGYEQQRETLDQAGDAARRLVRGVATGG